MNRTIYKYNVKIVGIEIPSKPPRIDFNIEFDNFLNYLMSLSKVERKKEIEKSEKVMYLEEYKKETYNDTKNIYYLKIASLKYNHAREVLNKDNLENKGRLKGKNDGDMECNHVVIVSEKNNIKAAFEYNYYGLQNLKIIISYLNDMIRMYFESMRMDKYYYLEAHNEVSKEFLKELDNLKEISTTTIVVETNRLGNTEFGDLANRNEIKDEIELKFKRVNRKESIPKNIIENYYNNNKGVKRIYLTGRNSNNKVKLDTEEMKQKEEIQVKANNFGDIESDDIFEKLKKYLIGE